jgi:hypothetical protein
VNVRDAFVLLVPGVFVLAIAVPFGLADDPVHLLAACVAIGLSIPPAFGTYWFTRWLAGRYPLGGVIGMLAGTMIRVVIAVGGGAAVYFLTSAFRDARLGFWIWVLVAYLATLIAETILLARASGSVVMAVPGGKG